MTSQQIAQDNLAAMVANFLTSTYGNPEAAALALQQGIDNNDLTQVRAGVIAAGETMEKLAEAAIAKPEAMAAAVAGRMGQYKRTAVDEQKANADILIQSCGGNGCVIKINRAGINLGPRRGIRKQFENGSYDITAKKLEYLQGIYNVVSDF